MPVEVKVLVLAFEAALYPTLLAAVIILLAQPHPKRMLAAYLGAGLLISITAGCLIVFVLGGEIDSSSSARSWTVDLAIGGLALLAAVTIATRTDVRWRERRRARRGTPSRRDADDDSEPWSARILARGSVPLVFLAGLVINVPGAAYLVGLKDIAAAQLPTGKSAVLILEFNLIMFLLAEIPLVGLMVAPDRTTALVDRMNAWMTGHSRQLAVAVCLLFGVFLIVKGLVGR